MSKNLNKLLQVNSFTPQSNRQQRDIEYFLSKNLKKVKRKLLQVKRHSFKYGISLQVKLQKYKVETNQHIDITPWFSSQTKTNNLEYETSLSECAKEILQFYDNFIECGSGWTLQEVLGLDLKVYMYNPIGGGCSTHVLPQHILNKKACLSIKCSDNKCFIYCILAAIHKPKQNQSSVGTYKKFIDSLNLKNISFPTKLNDVAKFEKQNSMSINVFGFEKTVFPLYTTKMKSKGPHINMLLYKNHYYLIKCLSRLLAGISNKNNSKMYYCNYCLNKFYTQAKLDVHYTMCGKDCQKYSLPKPNSYLRFTNFDRQYMTPFMLYCDFETMSVPCKEDTLNTTNTTKNFKHVPISFGVSRACTNKQFSTAPYIYRGNDCVLSFIKHIRSEYTAIQTIKSFKANSLLWTNTEKREHEKAKKCSICNQLFTKTFKGKKCADHDHFAVWKNINGKKVNYRSALCNTCNLKTASINQKLPVVFHNLRNYDSHLIIQEIHKSFSKNIFVIPQNTEKFMSFQFDNFIFIDSYMFLGQSLDSLAGNLRSRGIENFQYTLQTFGKKQIEYVLEKGVMCYNYITSEKVFEEKCLPPKSEFYNILTEKHITDSEYNRARKMWEFFKCINFGEYCDLYLKIDICLLTDVFENFRYVSHKHYGLDPAMYLSLPQYSFDCALKFTKVSIDLLSDIDMYNFFEKAIRGGICMTVNRLAKANNKYMRCFDNAKDQSYIMYLDCNNLYGCAMMQKLPYKNFHWLNDEQIATFNIHNTPKTYGYFLEVDLEYPSNLHDAHNDFPLACEKRSVKLHDLSPFSQSLANELGLKKLVGCEKLLPNLFKKEKYIVYYKNLKDYLKLGLQLKQIHKILAFKEKAWLRPYILYNTKRRMGAIDSFEKELFKLMINAVYGKFLESVKKRIDYRLVSDSKKLQTLFSKPTFKSANLINDNLAGVQMHRTNILLNKPIPIGATILERSKRLLVKFFYGYLKRKYNNKLQLLYMDTDSFVFHVKCDDFYRDMKQNPKYFDFSNFKSNSNLYSRNNKYKPGCWKDECGGQVIKSFCSLRPKMYSYIVEQEQDTDATKNKLKGVKRHVVSNILHDEYVHCLESGKESSHSFNAIRSYKHTLYTIRQTKKSLSAMDDKRWYLNAYESLAHGHVEAQNRKRTRVDNQLAIAHTPKRLKRRKVNNV